MSFFKRAFRLAKSYGGSVMRSPLGKIATKVVPGLGIASLAYDAYKILGPGGSASARTPGIAPIQPVGASPGGLPSPFAMGQPLPSMAKRGAAPPMVQGGGTMLPPTLPANQMRVYHRAPPGYVVVTHPVTKQKFAMLKAVAKANKLWKPSPKPPISVRDWRALKRSNAVVNKIKKANKMAKKIANFK